MSGFLESLLPWGYDVLLRIEEWRTPFWDSFFTAITGVGSEHSYVLLLSVVYWSVNKRIGRALSFAYLCSTLLNLGLKQFLDLPRPDEYSRTITGQGISNPLSDAASRPFNPLLHETSPSWPSNHAQGVVVSWGYLALKFKSGWLWAIAVALALAIGYSRMYVGVHFPQDVIGGWTIGVILLILWVGLEAPFRGLLGRVPGGIQALAAVLLPCCIAYLASSRDISAAMGAMSGLGLGYVLEGWWIRFDERGTAGIRITRAVLGLVIVFAVHHALRALLGSPSEGPEFSGGLALVCWARYLIVGLSTAFLVPWLFVRLGLSRRISTSRPKDEEAGRFPPKAD